MKRKILVVMLFVLALVMNLISPISVIAQEVTEENKENELTASKEAIKVVDKIGEYDVQISVPGKEREERYGYNFIIVIDGSYSTDEEWQAMRKSVIEMAEMILPEEKISNNINKVALISFGVDYHINIPLTNDKEKFDEVLPTDVAGSLLKPGRSATNTEAGLKGAREYIESLEGTSLAKDGNHTFVIYLSDGKMNLTEKPYDYYNYLINHTSYYKYARYAMADVLIGIDVKKNEDGFSYDDFFDETIKDLKILYSGNENDEVSVETIITELGIDSEIITTFLNEKIALFFSYCGYNFNNEYSAGEFERMFVNRQLISGDQRLRNGLLNIVYYAIGSNPNQSKDGIIRTIAEGNRIKNGYEENNNKKLATIYTIGYNSSGYTSQMILNPNYGDNTLENHYSSGYTSASVSDIGNNFSTLIAAVVKINYSNPVVVDYTSKWVIPKDINGDGIFNEKDITVTNNGNLVDNVNVIVEEVNEEDNFLELNSNEITETSEEELLGNKSGKIYKITWTILKDDETLTSLDRYTLSYKVSVDNQEIGFVSEYEYKANGKTTLIYDIIETKELESEDGTISKEEFVIAEDVSYDIAVPTVSQKENVVLIKKTDENENLISGAQFEIIGTNGGNNNIIKEYSEDGINYTINNTNNLAKYFRFRGLYNFNYVLSEVVVPDGYIKGNDMILDFTDTEDNEEFMVINFVNERETGEVIVNYVVLVNDEYIPFSEFAYDENGNLLAIFDGVNTTNIVLSGKIGDKFETSYQDVDSLTLVGLYTGNLITNSDYLNKVENDKYTGRFTKEIQEYTYVFTLNIGNNEEEYPLPPQTGYKIESNHEDLSTLLGILLFGVILFGGKIFVKKRS